MAVERTEKIWLNGELIPWEEARVPILTHTLHYGLGVFEGIRCYRCADGRSAVFRLHEHVARLHLAKFSANLTTLRADQAAYIGVPVEGPYKPEFYRY